MAINNQSFRHNAFEVRMPKEVPKSDLSQYYNIICLAGIYFPPSTSECNLYFNAVENRSSHEAIAIAVILLVTL